MRLGEYGGACDAMDINVRKWTWLSKFKSWIWLFAFHISQIPMGNVFI